MSPWSLSPTVVGGVRGRWCKNAERAIPFWNGVDDFCQIPECLQVILCLSTMARVHCEYGQEPPQREFHPIGTSPKKTARAACDSRHLDQPVCRFAADPSSRRLFASAPHQNEPSADPTLVCGLPARQSQFNERWRWFGSRRYPLIVSSSGKDWQRSFARSRALDLHDRHLIGGGDSVLRLKRVP